MPTVLNLKPEDIDTIDKRKKYTACVVGCGQKGILYASSFAEAGFQVICADSDQSLVKCLMKGKTMFAERETESKLKSLIRAGILSATNDVKKAVAQSDIIILTIAARIDDKERLEYSEVENSCKLIGAALHRGALVIYGGIASLGFTEGVVKETLENASGFKVGADFGLAYNPILMPEGQSVADPVSNRELRVAANDKASLEAASTVLLALTKKGIKQAIGFKTAEIAALFAVSRRDANTALSNEWAILCENAGVDYFETLKLMDCDNFGSSFVPTIGEKNRQSETYLLIESAENLNTKLRLPTLARQINENMVRHAASLTQDTLRSCGKTLRRARVAVLGVIGPNTSGSSFVKMLEAKGAKINLYDPTFAKSEMAETPTMLKRSLNEAIEGADCIIILTEQDQLKRLNLKNLRALMRTPAAIVDLVGMLEPQKVEKEGFIYRGLGRGIEKK